MWGGENRGEPQDKLESWAQEPSLCCRELKGPRAGGVIVRARWLLKYEGTEGYKDQE